MSDPSFYIIVIVLVVILLTMAAGLAAFLVRDLRGRTMIPPPHANTDLTNMTILFHTMRDVVAQQKQLAADFNKSLDRRVNEIRNVVELVRKERELLRQSRAQLNELIRRAGEVEAAVSQSGNPRPVVATPPAAPAAESEEIAVPEDDLIEHWTGLDFGESDSDAGEDAYDRSAPEPVAPEDAEAARDAFRTLLNLNAPEDPAATADQAAGNGRDHMNTIEQLVYEYSDAGMRVPDIARELGIGKGEVRLIQSLRKKKGH